MKSYKILITFIVFVLTIAALYPYFKPTTLKAQSTSQISITVKISICGNEVKEGGEDCDHADLNNQTCISQGYLGGILSCDYSCSFDFDKCIKSLSTPYPTASVSPSPTPTPAKTISPTAVSTTTNTATPNPTSTPAVVPLSSPTPTARPTLTIPASPNAEATTIPNTTPDLLVSKAPKTQANPEIFDQNPLLGEKFNIYDINKNGKIEGDELFSAIRIWVDEDKKEERLGLNDRSAASFSLVCDLNFDNICDVLDFSLLLYFINR